MRCCALLFPLGLVGCVAGVDDDVAMADLPTPAGGPAAVADDAETMARLLSDPDSELARALGGLSGSRLAPLPCDAVLDVVEMEGRCAAADGVIAPETGERRAARPIGNADAYTTPIRLVGSRFVDDPARSFTFVRVRSDAEWSSDALDNVLGTAPAGVCVVADGPLKDPGLGNALGYAFRVRDRHGRSCRGYVSATVVSEADRSSRAAAVRADPRLMR